MKYFITNVLKGALLLSIALVFTSCGSDDPGVKGVTFRKANIAGADMLAIAASSAETRAEGDITVGPQALYTVSEDGKMVQVSYNVEVEGADGEVAETIQANLIISPHFIFPVGTGWLWLANCSYDVKDGWSNGTIPQGPARHAISNILNEYNESHHDSHGGHFLIRKSDGAIFEWTIEAGAPDGMDDGFKQPTFLNGWFHQFGKDLFVKKGGWAGGDSPWEPKLYRLEDKGNTLDVVNILGDNINCWGIWPAENCLGVHFQYDGASPFGMVTPPTYGPILLSLNANEKEPFMLSIANKLYMGINTTEEVWGDDGKGDRWLIGTADSTEFYNLNVTSTSISLGSKICKIKGHVDGNGRALISSGETLTWWEGNGSGSSDIKTFDPIAGTVTSRSLPAHYPDREDEYVNGVGYTVDGTAGFWECDLSKDAAVYVALDWSSAAEYQSKIVPGTLQMLRFEAGSLTLQFKASMTDGTKLEFYTSVVGEDKGKIKTSVGGANNAGMVVTTMVRLN